MTYWPRIRVRAVYSQYLICFPSRLLYHQGEFIVPLFILFQTCGEIHATNRTQVFFCMLYWLILPKTHHCHWKSLISWTINHLRVNANIVNRSIGGWQPIWASRIDSLRASRIDSQMHIIWELLGSWQAPTRGHCYLHHHYDVGNLYHFMISHTLTFEFMRLRAIYCTANFTVLLLCNLCSTNHYTNTMDSLNLCVDAFSMFISGP